MTVILVGMAVAAVLALAWLACRAVATTTYQSYGAEVRAITRQAERDLDRIVQTAFRQMLDEGRRQERP